MIGAVKTSNTKPLWTKNEKTSRGPKMSDPQFYRSD